MGDRLLRASVLPDFVLRQFQHKADEPDHRQLYRILQSGIRRGQLAAGLKLPPSRVLAQALSIARNTVVHVYEQLSLEGYVQAGVGRGTFVADADTPRLFDRPPPERRHPRRGSARLSGRGDQLVGGAAAARQQWGAFAPGVPDVRLFPAAVWARLTARAWRHAAPAQLTYACGGGHLPLREAIASYLQSARGVACSAQQVVITSGTHQSLNLVAHLLADPGDRVWLEDPGYWGARSVLRSQGLQLEPVAVDAEGLAPSAAQLAAPPRLMCVSPSHQYPLGSVMSHGRRRQLLDYAAAHDTWVVEDDYDSEFRYGARPLPALQGLDERGRVLYLGTFSKTLFPSLRLAYLVLPSDLVDAFTAALSELYREGQTINQTVLADFIAEGHYATHIRRMRSVYRARHDALIAALQQHFGDRVPVIGGDAGLHLVLGLPQTVDDRALARSILAAGVATRPLSMYHLRPQQAGKGLLLGYGAVDEADIAPAVAVLARCLAAVGL